MTELRDMTELRIRPDAPIANYSDRTIVRVDGTTVTLDDGICMHVSYLYRLITTGKTAGKYTEKDTRA